MTDHPADARQSSTGPRVSGPRRSGWARRHPLLTPFPVVVSTVATFLVVLGFLAGQMRHGRDPALGGGAPAALIASSGHGSSTLVTRASGGPSPSSGAGSGPSHAATGKAPVTATSGSGGEGDD